MREALAILLGAKVSVSGTAGRFSTCRGYAGRHDRLLCLTEVRTAEGEVLADHLWIRVGRRLRGLELHKGDRAAFTATVERYTRGDGDEDYGLCRPHQCRVLERAALPEPPALEPLPVVVITPAETLPYSQARELLLARIALLQAETGTAPSLPRLSRRMAMPARLLLTTLHQLARDGQILFSPNGTITTAQQHEGVYA